MEGLDAAVTAEQLPIGNPGVERLTALPADFPRSRFRPLPPNHRPIGGQRAFERGHHRLMHSGQLKLLFEHRENIAALSTLHIGPQVIAEAREFALAFDP